MYCAVGILHKDKNTWVIFITNNMSMYCVLGQHKKHKYVNTKLTQNIKNSSNLPNIILGFVLGRVRDKTSQSKYPRLSPRKLSIEY